MASSTAITAPINCPITGIDVSANINKIAMVWPIILAMAFPFCQPYSAFMAVMMPTAHVAAIAIAIMTGPRTFMNLANLPATATDFAALAASTALLITPLTALSALATSIDSLTSEYIDAVRVIVLITSDWTSGLILPLLSKVEPTLKSVFAIESAANTRESLFFAFIPLRSSKIPDMSSITSDESSVALTAEFNCVFVFG